MYPVKCPARRGELYTERLVCDQYGAVNAKGHG